MKLTPDEANFLHRIHTGQKLRGADRAEDRLRQKMRRLGYAAMIMDPRRWVLTKAGRDALAERDGA